MTQEVMLMIGEAVKYLLLAIVSIICIQLQQFIIEFINEKQLKINTALIDACLKDAQDVLDKAIITTSETYAKTLKESGKFDDAAKKEAFEKTKKAFLATISEETLETLQDIYGNFDAWLRLAIESELKHIKSQDASNTSLQSFQITKQPDEKK